MKKLFMLVGVLMTIAAQGQVKRGDVNGDGNINSADVVEIYNIIINGDDDEPQPALSNRTFSVDGVKFVMVGVQGGSFQMGSETGGNMEKPVHRVTLSSYYIGQTEVTQALWKAVMGDYPAYFFGGNLPVEMVKWDECQEFIAKLNSMMGLKFRLPTEAEWEYAARGGNKSKGYDYSGSNTLADVAWYRDSSSDKTHAVGTKQANELGIYDMSGNVYEWVHDLYADYTSAAQTNPKGGTTGSYRVFRGGAWNNSASYARPTWRGAYTAGSKSSNLGFRLALSE